jgi:hypothetical protein
MTLMRSCGRALDVADRPGAAGRAQALARAALFAYLELARLGGADRTYEFRIDQQPFTIEIRDGHSQLQDGSRRRRPTS